MPSSPPTPTADAGLVGVTVSQREIDLILRDNKEVGVDRIKMSLNDAVILDNHTLAGEGTTVRIVFDDGANQVVIRALNEGTLSPNTVEVSISHVVRGPSLQISSGLKTGEAEGFTVPAP